MSSRFVSGGTNEQPIERDDEWLKAQQEIDAARRQKQERGKQGENKSLYDALQQNKMAKLEAFEESIKLRNQFQSLNEDDVDFLDSVRQSERAKEEAIRQETHAHLERFRQHRNTAQEDAHAEAVKIETPQLAVTESPSSDQHWSLSGKKRRRAQDTGVLKGVKVRKSLRSETERKTTPPGDVDHSTNPKTTFAKASDLTANRSANAPRSEVAEVIARDLGGSPETDNTHKAAKLGLAAYGSDSD